MGFKTLIFLFTLFFFCLVSNVSAYEIHEGNVSSSGYSQTTNTVTYDMSSTDFMNCLGLKDGNLGKYLTSASIMMDYADWAGATSPAYQKGDIVYKQGATEVGTGSVYYWLQDTDGDATYDYVYVKFTIDDGLDVGSGAQLVKIEGSIASSLKQNKIKSINIGTGGYNAKSVFIGKDGISPSIYAADGVHKAWHSVEFYNNYSYWYDEDESLLTYYLHRDSGNTSQLKINNGYLDLINETSLTGTSIYVYSDDVVNSTWDITILDPNVISHEFEIAFIDGVDATGTIVFDDAFYTNPEHANVSYTVDDMDSTNEYWMTVMGSQNGVSTWQYVDHDYEPEITDSEGTRSVGIFTSSFEFPFYLKAILYEFDSDTGETIILDSSEVIPYNAGYIPPGTISTDKSTYSIGEFVEITYTTQVEKNYISVHGPWKKWYRPNVPIGTNISFLYELTALDAGEVEVGLGENGVKVDSVSITVNQESGGVYVEWMNDNFNLGQMIGFYYNSTNTSAQIRVYDGEDNLVFGPLTTSLGYNDGFVNTEGTEPGTFLVSMLHNGTYYNDTTTVSVTDTWVRFGSNKYHIGDTIEIEYYLSDSAQSILLFDGNREKIITFTTQHAVLIPYSMQTIEFTLSEENEYGIDIPDLIDSGALPLGYWYVHVMDGNGVLDDYAWDNTYVSIATDDETYGIDASNEIITTFFSPEGLFMIFTAALAFMGLVAAKHPAGGGAGAVIGVGFGVYFNVLPVWMLMLMVIAFVVLAGATAAANLGGKK